MAQRGYPPSHRDTKDPQPEVCALCGSEVGAAHLAQSDVEGLRGMFICDVTPDCIAFRNAPSYKDLRTVSSPASLGGGQGRRLPGGKVERG